MLKLSIVWRGVWCPKSKDLRGKFCFYVLGLGKYLPKLTLFACVVHLAYQNHSVSQGMDVAVTGGSDGDNESRIDGRRPALSCSVILCGFLTRGRWVVDAGGGDSPLFVL